MPSTEASPFTFVMATGIVSVAAHVERLDLLSDALFALAGLAWLALFAVMLRRAGNAHRLAGLQTFAAVAATAVLGARAMLVDRPVPALALLTIAAVMWALLVGRRPSIVHATGGSLLVVVATESLAVLAALLAPHWNERLLFIGLAAWILGLLAYPVVVVAIAAEQHLRPRFSPDQWILMGALAISTLAGAELLLSARTLHALPTVRPPLRVATWTIWGVASCLIVPLAFLDLRDRAGWKYTSARWSFVFPLGMYAVATDALSRAIRSSALDQIADWFFYIALVCWSIVMVGLARRTLASHT